MLDGGSSLALLVDRITATADRARAAGPVGAALAERLTTACTDLVATTAQLATLGDPRAEVGREPSDVVGRPEGHHLGVLEHHVEQRRRVVPRDPAQRVSHPLQRRHRGGEVGRRPGLAGHPAHHVLEREHHPAVVALAHLGRVQQPRRRNPVRQHRVHRDLAAVRRGDVHVRERHRLHERARAVRVHEGRGEAAGEAAARAVPRHRITDPADDDVAHVLGQVDPRRAHRRRGVPHPLRHHSPGPRRAPRLRTRGAVTRPGNDEGRPEAAQSSRWS